MLSNDSLTTPPPIKQHRYDYLQFTDANGEKKQFDDTVGSDRWPRVGLPAPHKSVVCDPFPSSPQTTEFSGPKLHFYFHSDGSNNEWGYKFTVSYWAHLLLVGVVTGCSAIPSQLKAIGKSIPPLTWLFDLQVSLAKLLGLLCSCTLSTRTGVHLTLTLPYSN